MRPPFEKDLVRVAVGFCPGRCPLALSLDMAAIIASERSLFRILSPPGVHTADVPQEPARYRDLSVYA